MFNSFILLALIIVFTNAKELCSLTLNYGKSDAPLLLDESPKHFSPDQHFILELQPYFIYPDVLNSKSQELKLHIKEQRLVSCPGMKNHFKNGMGKLKEVSCKHGNLFLDNKKSDPKDVACESRPMGSVWHTKIKCHGAKDGIFHIIGFKIDSNWFIPQIVVCWDATRETTLYTKHVIYGQYLKKRVASPGRPDFKKGKLYSENIRKLYTRKSQKIHLKPLLGKDPLLTSSRSNSFVRGHLAPDADFVSPAEQDETYFYSNAIPQLQRFNNGNWKKIENSIRDLAMNRNHSLIIYSGTFGMLTLKDEHGKDVPLYLFPQKKLYPVPLVLWKVIYDPVAKEAAVLLGLNTSSDEAEKSQDLFDICDDICDQIQWLHLDRKDARKGAILCCSFNKFKKRVTPLENIGKVSLLKI